MFHSKAALERSFDIARGALVVELILTFEAYEMPHRALKYRRPEGHKADSTVKGLEPNGDIQLLGTALPLWPGFNLSLAGATTVDRHLTTKFQGARTILLCVYC